MVDQIATTLFRMRHQLTQGHAARGPFGHDAGPPLARRMLSKTVWSRESPLGCCLEGREKRKGRCESGLLHAAASSATVTDAPSSPLIGYTPIGTVPSSVLTHF